MPQRIDLIYGEEHFLTLGSLDEEADSDESGYVEAPPKSLIDQVDGKDPLLQVSKVEEKPKVELPLEKESVPEKEVPRDLPPTTKEKVDFIKCPISETIKKLANASLRSSKSLDISANNCLKALNLRSPRPEGVRNLEMNEESPSLLQRKQLLAQHGVTV